MEYRTNAVYLRKSRQDEGGLEETLRKHKEILLDFAVKNNLNISDKDIYEETISGESLYARPQMLKLLQNVENGMYDAVICIDIDRLGRGGMSDQGIIFETFKSSDTKIITPRKVYNLNDEYDEDNIEFESFMARRELKIIKRRLKRGTKKSIEEGCYLANPPFGYKSAVVNKRHTLEINEDEAKFVRLMFDMYANQGMGCQSIAYAINAMGAKPRRSNQFSRSSVMFILKNNVYIGKIVWDKKTHIRKNSKGNEKHIIIYNDKEKWTVVDGLHPPIIDMDTWNKTQSIILERTHPPSNTGEIKNPFSSLLYCGNCNQLMTRAMSRGMEYYRCLNKGCIKSTQSIFVNDKVFSFIKKNFENMVIKVATENNSKYTDYSYNIKSVNTEINKVNAQIKSLHDFLEQGVYDIPTFMERQKILNKRKTDLNSQLEMWQSKNNANKYIDTETMITQIQNAIKLLDNATAEEQNELLKTFIDKIIYYKKPTDGKEDFDIEIRLKPIFV